MKISEMESAILQVEENGNDKLEKINNLVKNEIAKLILQVPVVQVPAPSLTHSLIDSPAHSLAY